MIVAGDFSTGPTRLVNLTLANNTGIGVFALRNVALSNTLSFGNAGGPAAYDAMTTQLTNNLFFNDPLFADAANGNYRLRPGSPAINAGSTNAPGGIGLLDLDNAARVSGAAVDIGAYEFVDPVFASGFE